MATGGPPYTNPLRPRITIKTVDGEDTLYTYNAFDSSHTISINSCNMENSVSDNGTFDITINDHNNEIAKDNIHNVKVFLELGKTEAALQHFLIGYGEIFNIDRPGTNAQFYNLSGFGSKLWLYQLYINRRETYRRDESDAKIYNIIDNAISKRLWRPLKSGDRSITDITGISKAGISTKVNTPYTVLDKHFVFFGDLCDEMCDITGAVWFVDYSSGSEIFKFTYTPELATKIIIKSGDLQDRVNDDPTRISYIKSVFGVTDDTTTQAGTATRLFTVTTADKQEVINLGEPTAGSTTLTFRAIGQQVIIDNDARRIEAIELSMSKVGDPTSPNDRVNGDIVLDNGSNKPSNNILDEFHIPISSLKNNPEKIEVPLDISPDKLDVAQSKIWVRLFQRSNEEDENGDPDGNGDPNHGTKHTVRWHHNNILNTLQPYYSATANEGDAGNKNSLTWNTTNMGPVYRVIVYSNIRRLFARTNSRAANQIRLREQLINSDFLNTPGDVSRYISLNLAKTSKGRRGIGNVRVTVPDAFLYRPYQFVSFNDGLSNIQDMFLVQRAAYSCNSGVADDVPLGTLHADITLSGLYNTLVGNCTCL